MTPAEPPKARGSRSRTNDQDSGPIRQTQSSRPGSVGNSKQQSPARRSYSNDPRIYVTHAGSGRSHAHGQQLTPIPGSDASAPPSPSHKVVKLSPVVTNEINHSTQEKGNSHTRLSGNSDDTHSSSRTRTKSSSYVSHRSPQPQSLNAAVERITISHSDSGHGSSQKSPTRTSTGSSSRHDHRGPTLTIEPSTPTKGKGSRNVPPSPRRPIPAVPNGGGLFSGRSISAPTVAGRGISGPIPNHGMILRLLIRPLLKHCHL